MTPLFILKIKIFIIYFFSYKKAWVYFFSSFLKIGPKRINRKCINYKQCKATAVYETKMWIKKSRDSFCRNFEFLTTKFNFWPSFVFLTTKFDFDLHLDF